MHARVPGEDSLGKVLAFRAEGRRDVANTRVWIWLAWRELISQTLE